MTPPVEPLEDRYLSTKRAADFLDLRPRTLESWRYKGEGPAYVSFSRTCVRYRVRDLIAFAEGRKVETTGDAA